MSAYDWSPGGCCCKKWGAYARNELFTSLEPDLIVGDTDWNGHFNNFFPRRGAEFYVGEYIESGGSRLFYFLTNEQVSGAGNLVISWVYDIDALTFTRLSGAHARQWTFVQRSHVVAGEMIGMCRGDFTDNNTGVIHGPLDISTAAIYPNPPRVPTWRGTYSNPTSLTHRGYTLGPVHAGPGAASAVDYFAWYQNDALGAPMTWLNDTTAGGPVQVVFRGDMADVGGDIVVSKAERYVKGASNFPVLTGDCLRVGAWVYGTDGLLKRKIYVPDFIPDSFQLSGSIAYDGESIYMATRFAMLRADGGATEFVRDDDLPPNGDVASANPVARSGLVLLPF